ncbi:Lrp/AsnC family transcriptional regulator [Paenarthrobacter sp. NPDC089989]|uniref:Lrp/AsnC family transcriptional regulator n=1 Tax=unclassified Paenarthrobacter TaxID=2634190 RepID=UPI00381ED353
MSIEAIDEQNVLDELDRMIVQRLQVDGRASYRSIADEIGTSETTVRNRMRRLLDEDLIQVVTVVRPMTAPTTIITMYRLKVTGDPQHVAEKVSAMPECTFLALTSGGSDIIVELVAHDRAGMYQLWRDIHSLEGVVEVEGDTYLKVFKQLYKGPSYL